MAFIRGMSERAAGLIKAKPFVLRCLTPAGVISFTFDDFPVSALTIGGEILERHQARGTYYVAGGLTGTSQHGVPLHRPEDIKLALRRGHEIASQGFRHLNYARLSHEQIDADIKTDQHFIADITGTEPISFVSAFGARQIRTKS